MVIVVNSDFTIVSALVNPAPEWERVMMDQYTRVERNVLNNTNLESSR